MIDIIFTAAFAVLNRARGSKLFEKTTSTQVARIVSAMGMAGLTLYFSQYPKLTGFIAFIGFFLWALPGWGKYAGMTTGRDSRHETEIKWIDRVLDQLPIKGIQELGGIGMALRMVYAAPVLFAISFVEVGAYWSCLLTPLMGAVYYVTGKLWKDKGWHYGEYVSGGILGYLTVLSLGV